MSYVQMNAVYHLSAVFFTMFQGKAQAIKQYQGEKCKFWFSVCSDFQGEPRAPLFLLNTCCKKEAEFLSSILQGNKKGWWGLKEGKKDRDDSKEVISLCTACLAVDE